MEQNGIGVTHGRPYLNHGSFYRLYDPNIGEYNRRLQNPVRGTWRGALIGVGHNPAYPNIYRATIGGKVTITSDFTMRSDVEDEVRSLDVDVAFSDLKNVNTGADIAFAKQNWEIRLTGLEADFAWPSLGRELSLEWPPYRRDRDDEKYGIIGDNLIALEFTAPNYSEAVGIFVAPEALGAFGAKKQ